MVLTLNKRVMLNFFYAFKISPWVVFEVEYYYLGGNENPHFSTSASHFNRPRTDWSECGQTQKRLLTGQALKFYEKWDNKHLSDLTANEHSELLQDLKVLEHYYKFIYKAQQRRNDVSFTFDELKTLSKQK